jgi:hypothetical protein
MMVIMPWAEETRKEVVPIGLPVEVDRARTTPVEPIELLGDATGAARAARCRAAGARSVRRRPPTHPARGRAS